MDNVTNSIIARNYEVMVQERAGVGGGQAPCTRGNRCQWGEWISVSFNMQKGTEYM